MRPVHDSNGVYRFCIGVQFEVIEGASLKTRLAKVAARLELTQPRALSPACLSLA